MRGSESKGAEARSRGAKDTVGWRTKWRGASNLVQKVWGLWGGQVALRLPHLAGILQQRQHLQQGGEAVGRAVLGKVWHLPGSGTSGATTAAFRAVGRSEAGAAAGLVPPAAQQPREEHTPADRGTPRRTCSSANSPKLCTSSARSRRVPLGAPRASRSRMMGPAAGDSRSAGAATADGCRSACRRAPLSPVAPPCGRGTGRCWAGGGAGAPGSCMWRPADRERGVVHNQEAGSVSFETSAGEPPGAHEYEWLCIGG